MRDVGILNGSFLAACANAYGGHYVSFVGTGARTLGRRLCHESAPNCTLRSVQVPCEQIEGLLASGEADLALGAIRAAPDDLYQQQLFLHSFVTMVSVRNKEIAE